MKKIVFIVLLSIMAFGASAQQKFRLNVYGSYVFDDGFDVYNDVNTYYYGKIKGGFQWGGGVEFTPTEYGSIELLYLNKSSDVPATFKFTTADPQRTETFNLSHNYILAGFNGLKKFGTGKAEGYGGALLGVLISNLESPSTGVSDSKTDFAWGARVGTNIWISEKVAIKLQALVLSASKATGGGYYWSYWGPVYLNEYSTMWQFGLGGGLSFKLGK
jgi:hypothetical protein